MARTSKMKIFNVRLAPDEYNSLKAMADEADVAVAVKARHILRQAIRRNERRVQQQVDVQAQQAGAAL